MAIRIVWDESKRLINLERHGLDFSDVTLVFLTEALIRPTKQDRRQAIGSWHESGVAGLQAHGRRGCVPDQLAAGKHKEKGDHAMTGDHPWSAEDLRDVLDNPEWTAADIATAKRIDEIDPDLARNIRRELGLPSKPVRRPSSGATHLKPTG